MDTEVSSPTAPEPLRWSKTVRGSRRIAQGLAITPLATLLAVLTIIPTVYILVVSFTNAAATNPDTTFVAFDNYISLFADSAYWVTMLRTLLFVVAAVSIQVAVALALALAMAEIKRGGAFLRALILLPMAAAPIAMLFNWRQILNAAYGPVNYVLTSLGLPGPDWLGDPALALPTLIAVDTWQWTPFVFIILAGGLATIPHDVHEAASVDGASAWQRFSQITLPMLMPYVLVAVLFRTIDALKTFDSVQVLTSGGPGSATTMLNYSIFQQGISFLDFGKATASAVIFLLLCILLTNLLLKALTRKESV
ncbi:ABC transporter permease subunit [Microbacterium pseudoresistens]|uniref:Multiple sugar transport system permease protein n=1 Tax=Microbacterium pseudoresistens TaxID=640634 RepID=A0A7Y9EUJ2_9MICO|nr:multiple sugar transport system permease protein [Microbacterium pseudoresistens]